MEEIKKFTYEGNEITFLTGNNTMINANEMSKQFDVQPAFWLRTDQAKRLISALSSMHNCIHTDLVDVRMGSPDNGGGTWMHQDVAIVFAQWLAPEFYIWCNDRIKELLIYGVTAKLEADRVVLFSLAQTTNTLKLSSTCHVGRYKIYEELRRRGILDDYNVPFEEYVAKGYFILQPMDSNPWLTKTRVTEKGLNWLRETLYPEETVSYDNSELRNLVLEQSGEISKLKKGIHVIVEQLLCSKASRTLEQDRQLLLDLQDAFNDTKPTTAIAKI